MYTTDDRAVNEMFALLLRRCIEHLKIASGRNGGRNVASTYTGLKTIKTKKMDEKK